MHWCPRPCPSTRCRSYDSSSSRLLFCLITRAASSQVLSFLSSLQQPGEWLEAENISGPNTAMMLVCITPGIRAMGAQRCRSDPPLKLPPPALPSFTGCPMLGSDPTKLISSPWCHFLFLLFEMLPLRDLLWLSLLQVPTNRHLRREPFSWGPEPLLSTPSSSPPGTSSGILPVLSFPKHSKCWTSTYLLAECTCCPSPRTRTHTLGV